MRSVFIAVGLLFCMAVSPAHAAATRIALVIGNSNYTAITRLKNPARDARLIQRTLRDKLGFEVIYAENAGKAQLERAIARYGARLATAGAGAVAVFYYAGHGVQSGGENFLLPVDIALDREAELVLRSVRAEDVLRQMQGAKASAKIVILDACRDNPFGARFRMEGGGGLGDIALGNSEFIIGYAATSGLSAEDGDGRNSPYAIALARHLATPNQEISEILRMVRSDVVASTKGRQLPEARTTLLRALYLNGVPPAPAPVVAIRAARSETAPPAGTRQTGAGVASSGASIRRIRSAH